MLAAMTALHDCVLLAAGASRRMASFKPLLPLGDRPLALAAAGPALAAGCRVLLVVGHRGAELAIVFEGMAGVEIVENAAWEQGQLGSLQAALPRLRGQAFFVALADMPFVPAAAYSLLAAERAARRARGEGEAALFAACGGREGHPVLLPAAWTRRIAELDPGGRMRDFLERLPRARIETGDEGVLTDLDSPSDYESARRRLG
jgi:CTP:molybdopterin cytidylyltransferase MocA